MLVIFKAGESIRAVAEEPAEVWTGLQGNLPRSEADQDFRGPLARNVGAGRDNAGHEGIPPAAAGVRDPPGDKVGHNGFEARTGCRAIRAMWFAPDGCQRESV